MVSVLTPGALALIAATCLPPRMVPVILDVILPGEGGFNTEAVNLNTNGTRDWGLGQINETNFGWLSVVLGTRVDPHTILEPCLNLRASAAVLFKRYNGSGPAAERYAAAAMARAYAPATEVASAQPIGRSPPPQEEEDINDLPADLDIATPQGDK